jgi:hypothetical protein
VQNRQKKQGTASVWGRTLAVFLCFFGKNWAKKKNETKRKRKQPTQITKNCGRFSEDFALKGG